MKKKTRLILLTIIGALIMILVALGLSYAYMKYVLGNKTSSTLGSNNCAKILLMEKSDSINLSNTFPMSQNAGLNTEPYSFGVRSTCSGNRGFKLYIATKTGNTLTANNVSFALTRRGDKKVLTSGVLGSQTVGTSDFDSKSTTELSRRITPIDTIYSIYEDNLSLGDITYYDLYLWVSENATLSNANQSFEAAVTILEGEYDDSDFVIRLAGNINSYDANVSCEGADAKWDPLKRQVNVFDISKQHTICTVSNKSESNIGLLKDIVEREGIEEFVPADYVNLVQNKYNMTTPFYTTSFSTSVTSGTEEEAAISWDSTNNYWITNPSVAGKHYYYLITVADAGYYQLCYKKLSGGTSNRLYTYKITTNMNSNTYITASSTTDVCLDYGYVQTTDTIRIDQHTYSAVASLALYLKKSETILSVGYRYEGEEPNNYVWFNNELWRIIGSVPTKIDNGETTTTTNLVKIIRNESIGALVWNNNTPRPDWNASNLYTLLNSYYYGAQNATGNTYCYGNQSTAKAKCDYRSIGINSTSYYGFMIKEVYWNTGLSDVAILPSNIYSNEISIQTMKGKVGIMNISDYGFASSYNRPARTKISSYNTSDYTGNNWLYNGIIEWTITPYSKNNSNVIQLSNSGTSGGSGVRNGANVRPVVYLDSLVYVLSGDGTSLTPYKLGI